MNQYSRKLDLFLKQPSLLKEGKHGLEKECLRINAQKQIATTPHPSFLGSPLTHPYFSTDFGEAQLELITPAFNTPDEAFEHLENLHFYLHHHLKDEWLWPMSPPCHLADVNQVELAKYGFTKKGYEKWLYRKGLSLRYGKAMQLMSGIHYSFSFSDRFWKFYHESLQSKQSLNDFISDQYLHVTRNFLRVGWICSYLFGASPIVDKTYLKDYPSFMKSSCEKSLHAPYGTSIRMSHLGYFSKIQSQNAVSFNSLEEYTRDLRVMLNTSHPEFEKLGLFRDQEQVQMNTNLLQVEAEHYARIRPKPKHKEGESSLKSLERGIQYFETRILDLDPFFENALDPEALYFMHMLFIYCLFRSSPPIQKSERVQICDNQNQVALFGRKPGLKLIHDQTGQEITLKNWALEIIEPLKEIAEIFDQGNREKNYQDALEVQMEKVRYPYLTPSGQIIETLVQKKKSYESFAWKQAQAQREYFLSFKLPQKLKREFEQINQKSKDELKEMEEKEDHGLAGYEDMELSTQALLKEAMKQKIDFKIFDRKANFIRLSQGKHQEWVKQATQTRLDSLMTYLLMENKHITKEILKEQKLQVPEGHYYSTAKEAVADYGRFEREKVVVKPNLANYGTGISFVGPHQLEAFKKAVLTAEKHQGQILVEHFFKGEEYRFLVIDGKLEAICQRTPAHVVGDGEHTLEELIFIKNKKNAHRRSFQKPLKLTQNEMKNITDQGFTKTDIPKKGQVVFLLHNSNVATGGDSVDCTEDIPLFYKKIAVQAAKAVQATFCGVDMMIQDLKQKPNDSLYKIIELNFNPALYLHRYPSEGPKKYVEKAVLKALGF